MASSPAWQDITGAGFGMACPVMSCQAGGKAIYSGIHFWE